MIGLIRLERDQFSVNALQDSMIRLILSGKEEQDTRDLLVKRYRAQLTQYKQRKSDDVFDLYINALASLYDPHTSYFSYAQWKILRSICPFP